jgi:hypothetical protein
VLAPDTITSRCYLKQWAGPDGRLVEFSRRQKNVVVPRWTYPRGTGYAHDLYTIPTLPADQQNVFETAFAQHADSLAADSLKLMVRDSVVPTGQPQLAWTRFIMSLWHRTPERLAHLAEMLRKLYDEADLERFRPMYEKVRQPSDPPTLDEYLKSRPVDAHRMAVDQLMTATLSQLVSGAIMNMRWAVTTGPEKLPYPLLTSDRPIVMTNGLNRPDWLWLRHQPESRLTAWYRDRVTNAQGRVRSRRRCRAITFLVKELPYVGFRKWR